MCVDKLVIKSKLSCHGPSAVFTTLGHQATPIRHLAVLLQATGPYTLEVKDGSEVIASISKEGSGGFDWVVVKDLTLPIGNVFRVEVSNGELFELDLAMMCLCGDAC